MAQNTVHIREYNQLNLPEHSDMHARSARYIDSWCYQGRERCYLRLCVKLDLRHDRGKKLLSLDCLHTDNKRSVPFHCLIRQPTARL